MEQLSFLLPEGNVISNIDNTESNMHYCLWNGEYGKHDLSHIDGLEWFLNKQATAYEKYIGVVIGDFTCIEVEYDWGKRDQRWKVKCNLCGEESYRYHTGDWRRGKGGKTYCHCRKDAEEREREERKKKREDEIEEEIGKIYGKFKIIEYKGYDACKVQCVECGVVRRTGVTISGLKDGIYPKCDCGKANYGDPNWIGMRVGHLVVESYADGAFFCRCDCGRERVCRCTHFARRRYYDCGWEECDFISEARSAAINARIRGTTYEGIAMAVIKSNGYKVKSVGKVGDFGVDLIAVDNNGMKIAVQCKSNMKQLTGVRAVQEVYAGGRYYGLEHFAVISHSGYSKNAIKMAKKLGVYLSDGMEFIYPEHMEKYVNQLVPTYNAYKNVKAQKLYELDGKKKTLANWAFEYGVSATHVRDGLKKGLSLENALRYKPNTHRKTYTIQGFTGTLSELAEKFKPIVSLVTVSTRIKAGMSAEDAFFTPKRQSGRPHKISSIEEMDTDTPPLSDEKDSEGK